MTTRMVYTGRFPLVSAAIVALALGSCGDGDPSGPPGKPPINVTSVDVSPEAPTFVAIGDTIAFIAAARTENDDSLAGKTVVWASSDTAVAQIDSAGIATAVANGTSMISATIDGVTGSTTLAVSQQGSSLRIAIMPPGAAAGVAFDIQPVVQIVDRNGHVATNDDTTAVTARIGSGEGEIVGRDSATARAGVAKFTNLGVRGVVGERTLRFEADGLAAAVSDAFPVMAGPPESLRIRVEPGDAKVGLPLGTQPVLEIHDANGNVADDDSTVVTATLASGGGSIVSGGQVTVQAGVATFTDLAVGGSVGEQTLRFEAEGLTAAVSKPFTLATGVPATLHMRVEPAGARAGLPLGTQPILEVRDADGNVIANDDATVVTASIASGGGSIVGGGRVTVQAGVATFTDLALGGGGGERTLSFSAPTVPAVVSDTFHLTHGPGDTLRIVVEPAGAAAGVSLETQPEIEIRDAYGNVVEDDDSTTIESSIATGEGEVVKGASTTVQAGVATFTELAVGGLVGKQTLRFSASGLGAAVSKAFVLGPGPAASLSLHNGEGQSALADTELPVPFEVIVHDDFGNGVADVAVGWNVIAGTGAFQSDDGPTNDDGVTGSVYRLGRYPGVDTVRASASGLDGSPVTFTATATPNGRISGTVTPTSEVMSASTLARANAPVLRPAASKRALSFGAVGTAAARAPAVRSQRAQSRPEFVPGELIVKLRAQPIGAPPIGASAYRTPATAAAVVTSMRRALDPHERAGAMTVVGVSPAILTARLRVDPRAINSAEQALIADPTVARVERNAIVYSLERPRPKRAPTLRSPPARAGAGSEPPWPAAHRSSALTAIVPSDPYYVWQAWHYHMIDLPRAWGVTTGNASVVVAVLDDGIIDHPDIAANLTADGYDFVADGSIPLCNGGSTSAAGDGDGYDPDPTTPVKRPWLDECAGNVENNGGHGLHVAGIIGASSNNGSGVAGVNWNVAIRAVRVLDITGRGSHYDVAQGLLYAAGLAADDGAGGTVIPPTRAPIINMSLAGPATSTVLEDAVVAATDAGSLIIAAAGNTGSAAPNYPAAYPQAVSVSAVRPDESLASYSSFGPTIDIAAPGGETTLDCDFGVFSTTWNFIRGIRSFSCLSGTSTAAPHVAGVAALVLATQPGLANSQLRARLIDYAVPAGDANLYGAGIVNARNSLTQSRAPARSLYVRLIDADDGATIETVTAAPNGSYEFNGLDDANYYVYAGQDAEGDGVIGVPVRPWGAAGGSTMPTAVEVDGAGDYPASFTIGIPVAMGSGVDANVLPIGGYLMGEPTTQSTHEFLVQVPTADRYIFETSAVSGACGFALEADTRLTLYDESVELYSNDDIDGAVGNYCSRITVTLQPGTYRLRVLDVFGRYAVSARKQP